MPGESVIETVVSAGAPMWALGSVESHGGGELCWQTVDRALRTIARRRAALDADEARWLRAAEQLEIWRPLGMVSALDYLERVMGYAPRTAQDRLRVARALGELPELSAALSRGELAFSAVRELTRVATPATEAAWIVAAMGKSLRQVEELVVDHRPGDRPGDPPDPQARMHVVRFELTAETFARLRQARVVLDNEHGRCMSDDAFVSALCGAVLDGTADSESSGRARFQIAMTICARCRQGWEEGGGVQVAVESAAVDRALCDAQHIGSIDGDTPERAYQDVPPSVVRLVWRRDGGRCRVPGCRSARGLELHHLVRRADGGSHDASNLAILCSACHQAHHAGTLTITGPADRLEVRRPLTAAADVVRAVVAANDGRARVGACVCTRASDAVGASAHDAADDASARSAIGANDGRAPVGACVCTRASDAGGASAHDVADGANARSAVASVASAAAAHSTRCMAAVAPRSPADLAGRSRYDCTARRAEARDALRGLGWSAAVARAAVTAAATVLDADASLEQWIREALRRCPRPATASAPAKG